MRSVGSDSLVWKVGSFRIGKPGFVESESESDRTRRLVSTPIRVWFRPRRRLGRPAVCVSSYHSRIRGWWFLAERSRVRLRDCLAALDERLNCVHSSVAWFKPGTYPFCALPVVGVRARRYLLFFIYMARGRKSEARSMGDTRTWSPFVPFPFSLSSPSFPSQFAMIVVSGARPPYTGACVS